LTKQKYVNLLTGKPAEGKPAYVIGGLMHELDTVVAGSKFVECTKCEGTMLLAPDGQQGMAEGGIPICTHCIVKLIDSKIGQA
jgi:hypothetical protein